MSLAISTSLSIPFTEAVARTRAALAEQGFGEARDLADLAVRLRDLEVPFEAEAINSALADVRAALAELG